MPIIKAPTVRVGSQVVNEFVDTVGVSDFTYTFPDSDTRDTLNVFNISTGTLIVTVNGVATTIDPFKNATIKDNYTQFSIRSTVGIAAFRVRCSFDDVDEEDEKDLATKIEILNKKFETVINVKELGAKGDGIVDDSNAIKSALQKIAQVYIDNADVSGYRISNVVIDFPKGVYLINNGDLFSLYNQIYATTQKTMIYITIRGNHSTFLIKGVSGDVFQIKNNMKHVIFENIIFKSVDDTQAPTRILFNSDSDGNVSDFKFHYCKFLGRFDKVFNLTGSDTNSEFAFNNCAISGNWDSFIYVPADDSSDQFLNYFFNHCSYNGQGRWITMNKGGHVKLTNCDVSNISPTTPQYLFNFISKGNFKQGFSTFIDNGSRYELRNANARVFYSDINSMQMKFDTCDFSSQVPALGVNQPNDCFHFYHSGTHYSGNYLFMNCRMMGEVVTESDQGRMASTGIKFDNCTFPYDEATTFRFITHASYPKYSIPVYLKDCAFGINVSGTGIDYQRYPVNMVLPVDTNFKRLSNNAISKGSVGSSSAISSSWTYDVYKPTLLSRLTFISDFAGVSTATQFHIKTNIFNVTSTSTGTVNSTTVAKLTGAIGTIYLKVNDQVTLGTFDTIYTVTQIDQSTGTVYLDKIIADSVGASFSVFLIVMNVSFIPNKEQYTQVLIPYRMITNGLFIKAISTFSTVNGRVIVETLE
jgi:hypothetical protein